MLIMHSSWVAAISVNLTDSAVMRGSVLLANFSHMHCKFGGCMCADMLCCCCRHFKRLRKLPSASRTSELERSAFWSRHSSGIDLQPNFRAAEVDEPQAQAEAHASAHMDHQGKGGKHRSHAHHSHHRHHHHHRHGRRGSCGWRAEAAAVAGRNLDSTLSVSQAVHHLLSLPCGYFALLIWFTQQGKSSGEVTTPFKHCVLMHVC